MTAKILRLSTEYVWHEITTSEDLTDSTAEIAFSEEVDGVAPLPEETDWQSADLINQNGTWWVRFLVGPSGYALTAAKYKTFIRLSDTPEIIVRTTGYLTVE